MIVSAFAVRRQVHDGAGISWRDVRWKRWLALGTLSLAAWTANESMVFAQAATITWRIVITRQGVTQTTGPIVDTTTVPAQTVASLATATDGVVSITASLIGQEIPGIAPLHGRQLIVTGTTVSVAPGFFTPLGSAFPVVELYACYDFPLVAVGPPHLFGWRSQGSFFNIGGAGNDIDFATMGYTPQDGGCIANPPGVNTFNAQAFTQLGPVPFDSALVYGGFFKSQTSRLGTYHRFVVRNDGDAVSLPGSSEVSAQDAPAAGPSSALSNVGMLGLAIGLLMLGTFVLAIRARTA